MKVSSLKDLLSMIANMETSRLQMMRSHIPPKKAHDLG